ncbi:ABC transporter ATP-binding protein [Candidatus Thorarchaeota archaeon]|nr:MAG: ABC transporter ATP-binding protein [Candidatus Thorarchaeota archaeon]
MQEDNDTTGRSSAFRYMLGGLARNPWVILGALVLTVISALVMALPNVILGQAINILTTAGFTTDFINLVIEIAVLALIYMGMYFVVGYAWAVVTLRWERDARQDFFEALQEFSMTFHDVIDSKRLLSVAMQDINWVRLSLNPALRNLTYSIASFGITALFLMAYDLTPGLTGFLTLGGFPIPVFTVIMIIGTPLYLWFAYRYANAVEPVRRSRSEQMETLTSVSQGVFRGIEVVRAFGKENSEKEKFQNVSQEYKELVTQEGRLAAFYIPALVLIGMTTLAFFYGGYAVLAGVLDVGTLTSVLSLLLSLQGFNFMLPRMLLMLRGGYVNAQRIVKILNWEDPMEEPLEEATDVDWRNDIVFDNVSFKYISENGNNDHYALKNFSIRIPAGSRVALIGGPGGGKSTVLKLLLRLYDPNDGQVTVDGVDLRNVRTSTVRDHVGLVEQDIFLFRMTVKENIAFGNTDASQEEVVEAAKRAQAHEFIEELPKGYDSMIGERGMTLSGGQRQRLAIARAIIQDPQILLLDDSVSAVDAQTEYKLRQALDEVMKGRTSVTVTQRLRTLLESDLVIMVDKGELVAAGCHEDLLKTSKEYRMIFEKLPGAEAVLKQVPVQGGVQ